MVFKSKISKIFFESKKLNKVYFAQNAKLLQKIMPDILREATLYIPNSLIWVTKKT